MWGGRRMGKEEIGKQIDSKKFSKTMRCYGDDKLGNIIKEIYYDGMREGYKKNIGMIIWKILEMF